MEMREMVLKGIDNHPHPLTFCISGGNNTQCSLCGNDIDEGSWFYFCSKCSLRLHLRCGEQLEFPNKNRQEMERREMVSKGTCVRDNHQHPLIVRHKKFGYGRQCSLCCKNIDRGSWYYNCTECSSYHLHLYCGEQQEFVSLSSDPHPLKLLRLDNITCHYCEKFYQNILMYTCDECSVHIHQKCLVIPLPTISYDSEDHAQYMCHNHPMTLIKHDGKCDRVIRHCLACQSPWSSDLAYTCQKSCENVLHKACAKLPQKIEHPSYHPHHSLELQFCEPQSCSACYKRGGKLMYFCCDRGCNFILGTECAFLTPTMTWDRDDDHFLFVIERAYYGSDQDCYFCHKQLGKGHDEVIHTQSILFRCFECDFNIHFLCGPLPSIIKYECHINSLSLVDSIDDDDNSNDYYCDICEEKRNLQFRVYYCAKCQYVAHIHCVIPELDERHLKMKVVDVEGYKVPHSLAPVLQTLLREKRDFCRNARLRPEMKSIVYTFLCILLERMSMTKAEDITKDVLKHWFFYFYSIRRITGVHARFLYNQLNRLTRSFLGFEAVKFKKEMAERLQLQLETSKANLEKLKGIGESTASDYMKDCLRLSSEFKWKGCL